MDIAKHLFVGDSISYAKDDIVTSIENGTFPRYENWYAITTAFEEHHLLYIMSGNEIKHPMYHSREEHLTLIGIAGSKSEAYDMVQSLIQQFMQNQSLTELKNALKNW